MHVQYNSIALHTAHIQFHIGFSLQAKNIQRDLPYVDASTGWGYSAKDYKYEATAGFFNVFLEAKAKM